MYRGLITLDIDGTLTPDLEHIPQVAINFLQETVSKGWEIALLTGRSFSFAKKPLKAISFPFLLAVQNGADLLMMPEGKLLERYYLQEETIQKIEQIAGGYPRDFIIYSGFERGDFCYYRPGHLSQEYQKYVEILMRYSSSPWRACEKFDLEGKEGVPLVKCFGREEEMKSLYQKLITLEGISVTYIRDPIEPSYFLNLVTDQRANKGAIHTYLRKRQGHLYTIAAGDDRNDIPMLEVADFAIVMETAPDDVKALADFIAPPATSNGLIEGLKRGMHAAH